jgi:hypothetical protein
MIDSRGNVTESPEYRLATNSPRAPDASEASCSDPQGHPSYTASFGQTSCVGFPRSPVTTTGTSASPAPQLPPRGRGNGLPARSARSLPPHPVLVVLRRDYPERAYLAYKTVRSRCANHDPRTITTWR